MKNIKETIYDDFDQTDFRDTEKFKTLKTEVAKFIKKRKKVTWRELRLPFPDTYKTIEAVLSLETDGIITLDKNNPLITIIRDGGTEMEAEGKRPQSWMPGRRKSNDADLGL